MSDQNDDIQLQTRKLIRNSTAEFLIFTAQEGSASIEARYEDETIWLSQRLMAELFGVDVRTVSEHLRNIFVDGELYENRTIRKFRIVQREGSCGRLKPAASRHPYSHKKSAIHLQSTEHLFYHLECREKTSPTIKHVVTVWENQNHPRNSWNHSELKAAKVAKSQSPPAQWKCPRIM